MSEESKKDSKLNQEEGNIKETIGNITGDTDLEKEGQKDKTSGKVKEKIDQAADKAKDTIDKFNNKDK